MGRGTHGVLQGAGRALCALLCCLGLQEACGLSSAVGSRRRTMQLFKMNDIKKMVNTVLNATGDLPSEDSDWVSVMGSIHRRMKFYHLHIPRTAGTSFAIDTKTIGNASISFVSKEGCYNWRKRIEHITHVATFLRSPRSHVLSQFYFCSEGAFHGFTQVHRFRPWIQDWSEIQAKGTIVGDFGSRSHNDKQIKFQRYVTASFLPFHCYNPSNLQVQHFSCRGHPFNYTKEPETEQAIRNMNETFFVGITEAYKESLCLFMVKVHATLPEWCRCEDKALWSTYKPSKKTYTPKRYHNNASMIQYDTLELVDNLTSQDFLLYQAGLARFANELLDAEKRFQTKILCRPLDFFDKRHTEVFERHYGPMPGRNGTSSETEEEEEEEEEGGSEDSAETSSGDGAPVELSAKL